MIRLCRMGRFWRRGWIRIRGYGLRRRCMGGIARLFRGTVEWRDFGRSSGWWNFVRACGQRLRAEENRGLLACQRTAQISCACDARDDVLGTKWEFHCSGNFFFRVCQDGNGTDQVVAWWDLVPGWGCRDLRRLVPGHCERLRLLPVRLFWRLV